MQAEDKRNYVVLVNEEGQTIGYEQKLKAHQEGVLHKAFSIFIVNTAGKILLQQRAFGKYHFTGLWSNTCCSHPEPDEEIIQASHRRLQEEMGFDTILTEVCSFIYKTRDEKSGLYEHELDFVFMGTYDGPVAPNYQEINAYRWVEPKTLYQEMQDDPEQFTEWFKIIIDLLQKKKLLPV